MLTVDELRAWSRDAGAIPHREELARRVENGVEYEVLNGVHSWRAAEPMVRRIDSDARDRARNGLIGQTACTGQARGRIKHVASPADMRGFRDGDILLSPMTTPDVMYAIERAGAIVTDEGGVLCHAAIISRELNKPCVIGCEVATVAFADGDIVEVAATPREGSVRLAA
jgi:pyruvate,water dikinase